MGIQERLAVVEAKLGIETPKDSPVLCWDAEPRIDGNLLPSRYDSQGDDVTDNWRRFVTIPTDIVERLNALPSEK